MHPFWLRCSSSTYPRYTSSSRLASRGPRRPRFDPVVSPRTLRRPPWPRWRTAQLPRFCSVHSWSSVLLSTDNTTGGRTGSGRGGAFRNRSSRANAHFSTSATSCLRCSAPCLVSAARAKAREKRRTVRCGSVVRGSEQSHVRPWSLMSPRSLLSTAQAASISCMRTPAESEVESSSVRNPVRPATRGRR